MRVAACLVTRGNVEMTEIIESIPDAWEVVVWDNSQQGDVGVYGRYAAIGLTDAPVIYVQDDDAILDPEGFDTLLRAYQPDALTANMPSRFRHDFYRDHCLVGFGGIFHRDLPSRAFQRFWQHVESDPAMFRRTCDVVFTTLVPRHLVDVAHSDLAYASDPDRMWKQPTHQQEREQMLALARTVRDA